MKPNPVAAPAPSVADDKRREFLHKAAKYGVATPAAVTLLLAAGNKQAKAIIIASICDYTCDAVEVCTPECVD